MAAAQTAEQAFAVFDALSRGLEDAGPNALPSLYALTLRAGLNPLLAPFREDPLRPLSGEFISLDARLMSIFDDLSRLPAAASILRDFPADELWVLGEPPDLKDREPDEVSSQVGSIGGALYLPALGGALPCRIRVCHDPGDDPDRVGWGPPIAVRAVSGAIEASAANAMRAALFFIESRGLLPRNQLPGVLYYDVSGTDLNDDLLSQVFGNSLDLPLHLAFVSALIAEPVPENVGATGAIEPPIFGQPVRLSPVGHAAEKAGAFQSAFADRSTRFVVVAEPGELPENVTRAAVIEEALSVTWPGRFGVGQPRLAMLDSPATDQPGFDRPSVFLCARIDDDESGEVSVSESEQWKRLVTTALERRHGVCLSLPGIDETGAFAVLVRFPTVTAAFSAAESVFQSLRFFPGFTSAGTAQRRFILPGVGIHCRSSDLNGVAEASLTAQRHAVRIAEAANPGQVLLSRATYAACSRGDFSGTTFTALGDHRLRDLAPPPALWQADFALLDGRGMPIPARRPRTPQSLDTCPNNLPVQLTPIFGRERDIDTLCRLFSGRGSTSRLISIVGGGGIGKTRVALEAGANEFASFSDGVWFVRVEGDVRTAEDVAVLVSESLPFPVSVDPGETSPTKAFARAVIFALSGRRALLIFDGCDTSTVTSAVGAFATTLLSELPLVTILVTTRSRLGMPAETVYPLGPLTRELANSSSDDNPAPLNPAFELFTARARLAAPYVAVSEGPNREFAANICRQTEGIPLAIELAAAHVGDFPLADIAAGLGKEAADGSRRPSAMHRLLEWAYDLLEPHVQALLGALSIFEGGFDTEAAAAMVDSDMGLDDSLRLLADRSLITQRRDGSGRYDLHDLIQHFAHRKLSLSGSETAARAVHARYFAAQAGRHGADDPNAERERAGFDRLDRDLANIRSAVEFLRVHEPECVPRMVVDLANFLRYRGHVREWRSWPALALRLLPQETGEPTLTGALVHLCRAASFVDSSASDDADRHLAIASSSALTLEAWEVAAKALNLRSILRSRTGRWDDAFVALQEARDLYRRARSDYGEVVVLNNLGHLAARQSKTSEARRWFEEASGLARAIEDPRGLAIAIGNLGYLALEEKDLARARQYFEEGLTVARELHDVKRVASALLNFGDVLNKQEAWESGTPLIALAEAMFIRQRHPSLAEALRQLAEAETHYGSSRLEDLRREFGRLPLPALLQVDPDRYKSQNYRF